MDYTNQCFKITSPEFAGVPPNESVATCKEWLLDENSKQNMF